MNRGFLRGPWLPIYGVGALAILLLTRPAWESIPLTFLLGMAAATLVEGLTGLLMECLFHVRLWDYSQRPLNWRGYVCPQISLAWGCFALVLVRGIHPVLENLVLAAPPWLAEALSLVLTVLFVVDVTHSVQDALGLKSLLVRPPARLPDWETFKSQLENDPFPWRGKELHRSLSLLRRNPDAFSRRHREVLENLRNWKPENRKRM